ncbi:MAG: DNA internalization-related competence protein ComEC/Rec2 [Candidatus Omnitrophota bacterium]
MKRPVLYILIPFCLGIALSAVFHFSIFYSILSAAIFIVSSLLTSRNKTVSHAAFFLAVFFTGAAVYLNSNILTGDDISKLIPADERNNVFVRGMIADDPAVSKTLYGTTRTSFTLRANMLKNGESWRKVSGLVKADIFSKNNQPVFFGNEVILQGTISRPQGLKNPGLFNYADYLAIKNIYCCLMVRDGSAVEIFKRDSAGFVETVSYKIRRKMLALIDEYMAMPYSGFLKAILMGDKTGLKDSIQDDFVRTGTVHVIAVSGLQVGLIAVVFITLFRLLRIPRKINLVVTMLLLVCYAFIGGANPPIARAVIMFAVYVAGYLIDRDADILNSLSFAAVLILLWNPKELFDPSFQLSFVSLASTVIFAPRLYALFPEVKFRKRSWNVWPKTCKYITVGIAVSAAAWIGSFPVVAAYFNIISPVSVIANLLIVPALFVLASMSAVFFVFCFISASAAAYLANGLQAFEKMIFSINGYMADIPFAFFRIGKPSFAYTLLYYALASLIIMPPCVELNKLKITRIRFAIIVLSLLNIITWQPILCGDKDMVKITFLDVGQGDSAFVEFLGGSNMLIDGGPGGVEDRPDAGESVIAPFLWNKNIRTIDAVVVTHFHDDHAGGLLYILKNFNVGCVIDNGPLKVENDNLLGEYDSVIKEKNIRRITVREGDVIKMGDGAEIFVLNPEKNKTLEDSNDNSIVLKIVCGKFNFLFCADIKDKAISRLNAYGNFLKSDLLKIPHHGGNLGNAQVVDRFVGEASPEISVISVGNMNKYGMPSKKTLDIINSYNSTTYVTKDIGMVEIYTDGASLRKKKNFLNKN